MKVNGKHVRTVGFENGKCIMIEQNKLPFEFSWYVAETYKDSCHAIKTMIVRGAGAIGAVGAYAMAQAALEAPEAHYLEFVAAAKQEINNTRPTAQNLFYATEAVYQKAILSRHEAVNEANRIADENAEEGRLIGEHGNQLIQTGMRIETHCNAGWLAFVDYGSALAPIYAAHDAGKNVFVYADETRPRAQGGRLTAWELYNHGVPHEIIPDNAGAYLMAQGKVDMMIVGADRIVANGDVANKIGTLEKAIAAKFYGVPFYVAAPCSTFDLKTASGKDIPIEQRGSEELMKQTGVDENGKMHTIYVNHRQSNCINPAFDVTPAELIQGIITDKGIIQANETAIKTLFNL